MYIDVNTWLEEKEAQPKLVFGGEGGDLFLSVWTLKNP